ncbi:N-acetyl sugar amidotransferase (plasmid) [Solidesulfovibrio carbinoliphilus subsp. oakridgensis]|uniref:N-acetyl sugar amidotransferase n=1 Tax=Solidesulfovibrio carbinoliphilus subsp. oakridgensis TaxID=694327 RepID=G7QE78_9BACT|nr:N-acetyl sugar amidotransferase [Solidesulfovibrio carbinoliphilus]EHJ45972.1 N-acetyl sugar amidotransferase [Solidesulfovibrio carbinoliphilus subsp. oakridgensis]
MQYCTRCLYPANHPYGMFFDDDGVCSGCRVDEERKNIDWTERFEALKELVAKYRSKDGSNYDCVIGASGGKDSQYIVHVAKNLLGLNPLVVTYNHQFNTAAGIRNLQRMVKEFDVDHLRFTQKPSVVRRMARAAMTMMGDFCWHCHAGITTYTIQIAVKFKIPLVLFGESGLQDMVGMFSREDMMEWTKKVRNEHGLRGFSWKDFVGFEGLTERDLLPYVYPDDAELEAVGVRGLYLSNFISWSGKRNAEFLIEKHGFETRRPSLSHNCYSNVECWHCSGAHDYLKFLKFGFGRATDHAVADIRAGRISREQGLELVRRYDGKRPGDLDVILEFLGMTEAEFVACVDDMRDPDVWERDGQGLWVQRDSVLNHASGPAVEKARLPLANAREAAYRDNQSDEPETGHVFM